MEISLYSKDKKYFCYSCKNIKLEYLGELGFDKLYQCPRCKQYHFQKKGGNKFEIISINKDLKNSSKNNKIRTISYKKERLKYGILLFILKSTISAAATFLALKTIIPALNCIDNCIFRLIYKGTILFSMIQSGFCTVTYNVDEKIGFNAQLEKNILSNLNKAIECLLSNSYYDMECIMSGKINKNKIIEFIKRNLDLNNVEYNYIYVHSNKDKNIIIFTISKKDYVQEQEQKYENTLSTDEKRIINTNIYIDVHYGINYYKKPIINPTFMLLYQKNKYKSLNLNCVNYEELYDERKIIEFISEKLKDRGIVWNNIIINKIYKENVMEANVEILM